MQPTDKNMTHYIIGVCDGGHCGVMDARLEECPSPADDLCGVWAYEIFENWDIMGCKTPEDVFFRANCAQIQAIAVDVL